jgi:hypothetical protein
MNVGQFLEGVRVRWLSEPVFLHGNRNVTEIDLGVMVPTINVV